MYHLPLVYDDPDPPFVLGLRPLVFARLLDDQLVAALHAMSRYPGVFYPLVVAVFVGSDL